MVPGALISICRLLRMPSSNVVDLGPWFCRAERRCDSKGGGQEGRPRQRRRGPGGQASGGLPARRPLRGLLVLPSPGVEACLLPSLFC